MKKFAPAPWRQHWNAKHEFYSVMLSKYIYTTAQKMKFAIKDFFSKCDQIRSFLRICSHLLKKSLMENSTFRAVYKAIQWF